MGWNAASRSHLSSMSLLVLSSSSMVILAGMFFHENDEENMPPIRDVVGSCSVW